MAHRESGAPPARAKGQVVLWDPQAREGFIAPLPQGEWIAFSAAVVAGDWQPCVHDLVEYTAAVDARGHPQVLTAEYLGLHIARAPGSWARAKAYLARFPLPVQWAVVVPMMVLVAYVVFEGFDRLVSR